MTSPDDPGSAQEETPLTRRALRAAAETTTTPSQPPPGGPVPRRPQRPIVTQATVAPTQPTNGPDGPAWPVAPPGHDWIDSSFRRTRPIPVPPPRQPKLPPITSGDSANLPARRDPADQTATAKPKPADLAVTPKLTDPPSSRPVANPPSAAPFTPPSPTVSTPPAAVVNSSLTPPTPPKSPTAPTPPKPPTATADASSAQAPAVEPTITAPPVLTGKVATLLEGPPEPDLDLPRLAPPPRPKTTRPPVPLSRRAMAEARRAEDAARRQAAHNVSTPPMPAPPRPVSQRPPLDPIVAPDATAVLPPTSAGINLNAPGQSATPGTPAAPVLPIAQEAPAAPTAPTGHTQPTTKPDLTHLLGPIDQPNQPKNAADTPPAQVEPEIRPPAWAQVIGPDINANGSPPPTKPATKPSKKPLEPTPVTQPGEPSQAAKPSEKPAEPTASAPQFAKVPLPAGSSPAGQILTGQPPAGSSPAGQLPAEQSPTEPVADSAAKTKPSPKKQPRPATAPTPVVEAAATPAATTQPAPLPPADVTAISPAVSQQANPPDSKPQNLQSNRSAAVDSPAPQPVLPRRRVGRVILISVLAVALITASLLVFFNWRDRNNSVPDSQDSKATSAIANYGAASQTPSAEPTAGQPGATTWSLQREFISGDCSLVVIELESGLTDLVGDGGWTPQNGQFVSLQVAVTYHGAGEGHFPPEDQVLTTSSGRTYQPDTSSAEKMGQVLGLNPLQPEQAQVGYLVFDIAKDEQPTALEFKSDLLSEPVQIPFG